MRLTRPRGLGGRAPRGCRPASDPARRTSGSPVTCWKKAAKSSRSVMVRWSRARPLGGRDLQLGPAQRQRVGIDLAQPAHGVVDGAVVGEGDLEVVVGAWIGLALLRGCRRGGPAAGGPAGGARGATSSTRAAPGPAGADRELDDGHRLDVVCLGERVRQQGAGVPQERGGRRRGAEAELRVRRQSAGCAVGRRRPDRRWPAAGAGGPGRRRRSRRTRRPARCRCRRR